MRMKRPWRQRHTKFSSWEAALPQEPTRRFIEGTTYLLPKDEEEGKRLYLQHYALFQVFGNHYVAPLDPSFLPTILDCGAGTGICVADMASAFPQTLVVGYDLDPLLFRAPATMPSNCLMMVEDVLTGLPFPDCFFAYTHQRLLVYAIQPSSGLGSCVNSCG